MILCVDMGNTHIVLGCMEKNRILFTERITTDRRKTEIEYAICIQTIMQLHSLTAESIEAVMLSSVVPPLVPILKGCLETLTHTRVYVVGPGLKTGLSLHMDHPSSIGSDLVVGAVAVKESYGTPSIMIDMGTATTLSILTKDGAYSGTIILPGIGVELESLTSYTAQLPQIELSDPPSSIGTNTADCMRSGLILGNAATLDGLLDRIEEEWGYAFTAVATGGLSHVVIPYCKHKIILDEDLLLHGLAILYERNRK